MIRATADVHKKAVAFHEAGHAVLLRASGHQIEGIHLVHSINDWEGIVYPEEGIAIADDAEVKIRLAGPLAECLFWAAFACAEENGGQVEQFLESIAFDPDDKMCRLTKELLAAKDADESCCAVAVSFIKACGEAFPCNVPLNGLDGDFWHAYEKAKTSGINADESLLEVRGILSEAATWDGVMRLAVRVLQEPEREVTVGKLLELGKPKELLKDLADQPVQHVVLSGNEVHAILDNSQ